MKIILCLAGASVLLSSASLEAKGHASRIGRGDLLVTGYASTRAAEALDEFGMSSDITAELRISKVLRGRAPSQVLTIRYIAHTDLPEDSELRFHLRRSSASTWLVCKEGKGLGYICA